MSLLDNLKAEHETLTQWIDSAEASQESTDFPVDARSIEDARYQRGRLEKLIESLEQPYDVGGWEDH